MNGVRHLVGLTFEEHITKKKILCKGNLRIWIVDILYVYPKEKISSAVGFEPGLSVLSDILYSNNLTTLSNCTCLCGYILV